MVTETQTYLCRHHTHTRMYVYNVIKSNTSENFLLLIFSVECICFCHTRNPTTMPKNKSYNYLFSSLAN